MLGSQKWNTYTYIHLLQCGKGVNLISDTPRVLWLLRDNWFGKSLNPLNAASVYIRSKITPAYHGERIYTLTIISAAGQTLPILWHA